MTEHDERVIPNPVKGIRADCVDRWIEEGELRVCLYGGSPDDWRAFAYWARVNGFRRAQEVCLDGSLWMPEYWYIDLSNPQPELADPRDMGLYEGYPDAVRDAKETNERRMARVGEIVSQLAPGQS